VEDNAMGASETSAKGMEGLTPRQQKWFASVKANLAAQTGKPIEEWVEIARSCPHAGGRAQARWLKEHYGVGINHASFIFSEAFPRGPGWDDPEALRAELWKDPTSAAILEAVEAAVRDLPGLVQGQRKGYTALSKDVQFAAIRPLKGGRALLGLKLDPSVSPRLKPAVRKESWSERLSSVVELDTPGDVDAEIRRLLAEAYKNG
jgi:hypothetical protein